MVVSRFHCSSRKWGLLLHLCFVLHKENMKTASKKNIKGGKALSLQARGKKIQPRKRERENWPRLPIHWLRGEGEMEKLAVRGCNLLLANSKFEKSKH